MLNCYFEHDSDCDVSVKPESCMYKWNTLRKMALLGKGLEEESKDEANVEGCPRIQ